MDLEKIVHWTLLGIILAYITTGLLMLYNRTLIAYNIHIYLLIPFLIILAAHIILVLRKKKNEN